MAKGRTKGPSIGSRKKNACGKERHKPVVLITGASSGFGEAGARHLEAHGYRVYGTSRRASFAQSNGARPGATGLRMIPMDVCETTSVQAGVDFILRETGRIDVVVCNAGFGVAGSAENTSVEEAQNQFDTNFFGVWRVCRAVLPLLRRQGGGYIIVMSSLAGLMGIPFQAAYSASKFALEGFAEALRMEVKPWNIHVVLIEPGDFRTGFTQNRTKAAAAQHQSVYAKAFRRALSVMEDDERRGPSPDQVGRRLERIITHPSPRLRYTAGSMLQRLGGLLKRILPGGFFEWLMMQTYKLL